MTFRSPSFAPSTSRAGAGNGAAAFAAFQANQSFDEDRAFFRDRFFVDKTQPFEVEFSNPERDRFADAFRGLHYPSKGSSFAAFAVAARAAFERAAPVHVLRRLYDIQTGAFVPAAVVFRNLPFDPSVTGGPLPGEFGHDLKSTAFSEAFLCGLGAVLGVPYGVDVECDGVLSNVFPDPRQAEAFTGSGSEVELGFHTESAALRGLDGVDRSPDWLALIGVAAERGRGPATMIADGRIALANCPAWVEQVLREESLIVRVPVRWRDRMSGSDAVAMPGVFGPAASPSFRMAFYRDLTEAPNARAKAACEAFLQQLIETAVPVFIEPGMAVLIDNHVGFHAREAFVPQYRVDRRPKRWLQRVFITSSRRRLADWKTVDGHFFEVGQA